MLLRSLVRLASFVVLGGAGVIGCAADDAGDASRDQDSAGAEVDELDVSSLRGATTFKGSITAGSTVTVHYDRSDARYLHQVPYLAVEIVSAPSHAAAAGGIHTMNGETIGAQRITVRGTFPGTPRALVVDEEFHVLASARGLAQPDGSDVVDLHAPRGGKRFVLVRDGRWSKPMEFEVGVGR